MGLFAWAESTVKKLDVYDFAVLKTAVAIFGIVIGAYIAEFVKLYVVWFIIAFVVLYTYLLYKVFS